MIKLHHLAISRSSRIIWLLEELGLDYELIVHERDPKTFRAPATLKQLHPMGKAPAVEIDGRIMIESGAIIEYIIERHGGGALKPPDGLRSAYLEWLHFTEGTLGMPMLLAVLGPRFGGLGDSLGGFVEGELLTQLDYLEHHLSNQAYLVGESMTGADINLIYMLEHAFNLGQLEPRPATRAYYERLIQRPAYLQAIARGGPITLGPAKR